MNKELVETIVMRHKTPVSQECVRCVGQRIRIYQCKRLL